MSKKSAVSFPPQDKSSGFHSTQLIKVMSSHTRILKLKEGDRVRVSIKKVK
jgi:hypothetical protein